MDVTKPIRKFLVALAAFLADLAAVTADGDLTVNEGIGAALVLLGALGVYAAPNITRSSTSPK